FDLLGGNIVYLRIVTILINIGLATSVFYSLFRSISEVNTLSFASMMALSFGLSAISLIFLNAWLVTPSYNSLAFQSLMVCAIGVLNAENHVSKSSVVGWILVGIGGALLFLAKPPAAVMLGFVVLFCFWLGGKIEFRLLLCSIGSSLLVIMLSAWLIDGSIDAF